MNKGKEEVKKGLDEISKKVGVTVPTDVANAIEGFEVGQVTSVLKEKCVKVSGSDAAYEQAEVSGKICN